MIKTLDKELQPEGHDVNMNMEEQKESFKQPQIEDDEEEEKEEQEEEEKEDGQDMDEDDDEEGYSDSGSDIMVDEQELGEANLISHKHAKLTTLSDRQVNQMEFPEEVNTPSDQLSSQRFQKYQGLKNFRTSYWDPYVQFFIKNFFKFFFRRIYQ